MEKDEEKLHEFDRTNPFMMHNNIKLSAVGEDEAEVKVDLTEESMSLMGRAHGGLIYTLADIAGGVAARTDDRRYVTQSAHINFLSNVDSGTIYARSKVVKRGKRIVVVHVSVVTEDGQLLADAAVDMCCISEP